MSQPKTTPGLRQEVFPSPVLHPEPPQQKEALAIKYTKRGLPENRAKRAPPRGHGSEGRE